MIKKAIIPVAGKGTRFLPMTNGISKEMLPIADKPCLFYVLKECADSGITEIALITRESKKDIKNFFTLTPEKYETLKKSGKEKYVEELKELLSKIKITYFNQREDLIGTAGAIYVAKEWANNQPFAVLFGDDLNYTKEGEIPAIGQLCKVFEKTNKMVLGCKEVPKEEASLYGMCNIVKKIDEFLYEINGVVEKPKAGTEPSLIGSLARYVMPANTFEFIEKQIEMQQNKSEEMCLPDTMDMIMKSGKSAIACIMQSNRYDTGDKFGYFKAFVEYLCNDKTFGDKFKKYLKEFVKNI